jgi:hypothetical protein
MTLTHEQYREMARRAAARNNLKGFGKPTSNPREAATRTLPNTNPSLLMMTSMERATTAHPPSACGRLYPYYDIDAIAIAADYDLPLEAVHAAR